MEVSALTAFPVPRPPALPEPVGAAGMCGGPAEFLRINLALPHHPVRGAFVKRCGNSFRFIDMIRRLLPPFLDLIPLTLRL